MGTGPMDDSVSDGLRDPHSLRHTARRVCLMRLPRRSSRHEGGRCGRASLPWGVSDPWARGYCRLFACSGCCQAFEPRRRRATSPLLPAVRLPGFPSSAPSRAPCPQEGTCFSPRGGDTACLSRSEAGARDVQGARRRAGSQRDDGTAPHGRGPAAVVEHTRDGGLRSSALRARRRRLAHSGSGDEGGARTAAQAARLRRGCEGRSGGLPTTRRR